MRDKRSIRNDMRIQFSIFFTVILTIIFGVSYYLFYSTLIEREYENRNDMVRAVVNNLDYTLGVVENSLSITSNHEDVTLGLWTINSKDYPQKLIHNRNTSILITSMILNNVDIDDIMVINNEGYVYESYTSVYYDYSFFDQEWFPDLGSVGNDVKYINLEQTNFLNDYEIRENIIFAVTPVWHLFSDKPIGAVIALLNKEKIGSIIDDATQNNDMFYIYDGEGNVISSNFSFSVEKIHQNSERHWISIIDGVEYLAVKEKSKVVDWEVTYLTPLEDITAGLRVYGYIVFIIYIAVIGMIILITSIISARVSQPIAVLASHMNSQQSEELATIHLETHYKETDSLATNFNEMVKKNFQLINKTYKLEIEHKETQIRALQSRINPHFLFNALQSIQSLAILEKTEDIKHMINDLGHLFRYIIYDMDNFTTVSNEYEHLKAYINIQLKWLGKKCEIKYDISEEIMEVKIPKLTLQPIAENIFRHGMKKKEDLYIDIKGNLIDGKVVIIIRDNGVGMDEEKQRIIREDLKVLNGSQVGEHIGLRNVNRRLVLEYGEAYGIKFDSKIGRYTKVTVTIPLSV